MKALSTFSVQRNEAQMDVICHEFERLAQSVRGKPVCLLLLPFIFLQRLYGQKSGQSVGGKQVKLE